MVSISIPRLLFPKSCLRLPLSLVDSPQYYAHTSLNTCYPNSMSRDEKQRHGKCRTGLPETRLMALFMNPWGPLFISSVSDFGEEPNFEIFIHVPASQKASPLLRNVKVIVPEIWARLTLISSRYLRACSWPVYCTMSMHEFPTPLRSSRSNRREVRGPLT